MSQKILIHRDDIAARVAELGREITAFYNGEPLTVIALLNGGLFFAADLIRHIHGSDVRVDSFAASSYENDTSSGNLTIRGHLKLPVEGRHVLLVDDILDTGKTLEVTMEYFRSLGAASVRSCVFLNKQLDPSKPARTVTVNWHGFEVPDLYVIGYGLDSRESFRNLPDVCVVTQEVSNENLP